MSTDERCTWIPDFTSRGHVSRMFHLTHCGVKGAATFAAANWKFCPYCGHTLVIKSWREVYEGLATS